MKKYFKISGDFSNTYALLWADDENAVSAEYPDAERITRAESLRLAREERERRRCDAAFSNFADAWVYPYNDRRQDGRCPVTDKTGVIVTGWK